MRLICLSAPDPELESALTDALSPYGDRVRWDRVDPRDPDPSLLAAADGVLCAHFPPELRALASRARWIQFWSAGVDNKIYPELFRTPGGDETSVCTGSGIHVDSCANHVMAMLLSFARGLPLAGRLQARRTWDRDAVVPVQFELEGATMGIVGTGAIGAAIATRAKAFGMRTIGVWRHADRPVPPGFDVVLPHIQYHEMVVRSRFIVLALPLTPGTKWTFGEDEIEVIPKGSYLFNIGRGGLIDERAVREALNRGWLAGAGLDVFEEEPLPPDSPWWDCNNVIITPHAGGNTPEYWPRLARLTAEQVGRALAGEPLVNRVDPELGY
ncbi:MAG: D-2-hydroxyacid dehydrogenase [Armatimonadota bacterium]